MPQVELSKDSGSASIMSHEKDGSDDTSCSKNNMQAGIAKIYKCMG